MLCLSSGLAPHSQLVNSQLPRAHPRYTNPRYPCWCFFARTLDALAVFHPMFHAMLRPAFRLLSFNPPPCGMTSEFFPRLPSAFHWRFVNRRGICQQCISDIWENQDENALHEIFFPEFFRHLGLANKPWRHNSRMLFKFHPWPTRTIRIRIAHTPLVNRCRYNFSRAPQTLDTQGFAPCHFQFAWPLIAMNIFPLGKNTAAIHRCVAPEYFPKYRVQKYFSRPKTAKNIFRSCQYFFRIFIPDFLRSQSLRRI